MGNYQGKGLNYNYSSILRKEASAIFFERLSRKLALNIEKYFGKGESQRVIKLLGKGRLKIVSPETFLFSSENLNDSTLDLYNTCSSVEEFFYKGLMYFKKRAERGETDIVIREFLLAFADLFTKSRRVISQEELCEYIRTLIPTTVNATHPSPFAIELIEPRMRELLEETTGLDLTSYNRFIQTFLMEFQEFSRGEKAIIPGSYFYPAINIVFPVYEDTRFNQELYLSSVLRSPREHTISILKTVPSLSEDSPALRVAIDTLAAEKKIRNYNADSIILELERIAKSKLFKTYPTAKDFSTPFHQIGINRAFLMDRRVNRTCTNLELFRNCFKPYLCNILIDCSTLSHHQIEAHISAAKTLGLLKTYHYSYTKNLVSKNFTTKITLVNVSELNQNFVDFVKNKIEEIKSLTNREFYAEIQYKGDVITSKAKSNEATHIRVISDIHADYNRGHNYAFNFGDDFVINCGDTGGDAITCIDWNRNHIRNGVTVIGNHLGYSSSHPELNKNGTFHVANTKNSQLKEISASLTGISGPQIMSNSIKEYKGMIIIGTCLYTDFNLYGETNIAECMNYAKKYINDFKYPMVVGHREYSLNPDGTWKIVMKKRSESTVRPFTPEDHAYFFHFSFNFIKEKVVEYAHKPIIIVTHHAPSPHSISKEYRGSMLNPAFVSDLNDYIIQHPQIRLWCHGHVHSPFDYILGETRVVCNPFGYNNENNADLPYNYGTRIAIADIKSKKSWKDLCEKEISNGLIKVYQK